MAHSTKHLKQRMSQRGITADMIEVVGQFGLIHGDRTQLTRRELEDLLARLRSAQRTVMKLLDKGGIVVVEDGGALITTYNLNSYNRRRANRRGDTGRRPRAYRGATSQ